MADQILKVYNLGFRFLRRTKSGTTDFVVYQNTTNLNIRAYGVVDPATTGYCHLEFRVSASDCVITTLNDTALNPSQGCGFVKFSVVDNNGYRSEVSVVVTDFVQESASPDYKFWLNGWSGAQKLVPLI